MTGAVSSLTFGAVDPAGEIEKRKRWFYREVLPLQDKLRRYALQTCRGNAEEADDLLQDAYVRALRNAAWQQVRSPRAFMTKIIRNLRFDTLRREQIVAIEAVADLDSLGLQAYGGDPEATAIGRDELRRLAKAIASLPPQCRRVFTLRKIYGLSHKEIADKLGLSVSTVEKHLAKGLRLCLDRMDRTSDESDSDTAEARRRT